MIVSVTVDPSQGIDMGALVIEALHVTKMQHKVAWSVCGVDKGQWSKSLYGKAPLDLWKLRHLPAEWWLAFLMLVAKAVVKELWLSTVTELQMAKADLRLTQRKESA